MIQPEKYISLFQRTHWIIKRQTEGLTHADSLLQLPFRANNMNWILGHIVASRNGALAALGEPPALDEKLAARYERDSEPITGDEDAVLPLAQLLTAVDDSQERMAAALDKMTPEELNVIFDKEHQNTLGDRLTFLHWHETYHVGQLEILRQLAGKDDKII